MVNPAMDRALALLQAFAVDARNGLVSKDRLRFGAPWRHPPKSNDPRLSLDWAKIQLMDFVQCLVDAEFGVTIHVFEQKLLVVNASSCVTWPLNHVTCNHSSERRYFQLSRSIITLSMVLCYHLLSDYCKILYLVSYVCILKFYGLKQF